MTDKESQDLGFNVAGFIPLDEWNKRFADIMIRLHGRTKADSLADVAELFKLHNDKFRPTWHQSGCGSCVQKVMKRMEQHYAKVSAQIVQAPVVAPVVEEPKKKKKK
jgi:hypothetical protein